MKHTLTFPALISATVAIGIFSQAAVALQEENFSFKTTRDLYGICATGAEDTNYVTATQTCRAFIAAAVQYHDEVTNRKNLKPLICYPKGTTLADGKAAFVAWAQKHSGNEKLMGEVPVVGLVRSLAAKYPCKG